ncbi:hypothetical protein Hypma_010693 [Hypsizygus marmoreus]|uniref:PWWP domain-containing protein n=1 Tax=Hypsizygus marmoreus TaxID=39966 RepID=A0A369JLH8_HYPMA|nr:hypothetical protein Hypma_010693 [Hypsizygus marmoreus]
MSSSLKAAPSSSETTTVPPRPRPRPLYKAKKPVTPPPVEPIPVAIHVDVSDDSDLTPLTSPVESTLNQNFPVQLLSTSQKRSSGVLSSPSQTTGAPRTRPSYLVNTDPWDAKYLGSFVWVLLDRRARVLEPEDIDEHEQQMKERLWWPGKITSSSSTDVPLKVRLFGSAAPKVKTIEIHSPCELNVLSLEDSQQCPRFERPTFVTSIADTEDLEGSPRKRQKYDRSNLEERWRVAVAEMVGAREEEDGSDVLPEVGALGFVKFLPSVPSPTKSVKERSQMHETGKGKGKGNGKGRRKKKNGNEAGGYSGSDSDGMDIDWAVLESRWSPPPPEFGLEIPGELILAQEKATSAYYWPARILEYKPPGKAKQEAKYLVQFLDEKRAEIPRKWFYTSDDDDFGTCKLGVWESEFKEVVNDDDESDCDDENDAKHVRSPSPLPASPPPVPEDFVYLSVREQFVYTKPVLQAVLNAIYEPAMTRHDKFVSGGQARKKVVDEAGMRGRMDPKDVVELQKWLTEWCLRDERRAKRIIDEVEDPAHDVRLSGELVEAQEAEDPSVTKAQDDGSDVHVLADAFGVDVRHRTRSPSPTATESVFALSQCEIPPQSSFTPSEVASELPPISTCGMSSNADSPRPPVPDDAVETDASFHNKVEGAANVLEPSPDLRSNSNNVEHVPPPRQHGCDGYEALAGIEKVDYCLNVLLPEAILQILLWRNGLRRSVDLLSDGEEMILHWKGEELIKESDWVNDVMRLRGWAERQAGKDNAGAKSKARRGRNGDADAVWSDNGRQRRNVTGPKSYRE